MGALTVAVAFLILGPARAALYSVDKPSAQACDRARNAKDIKTLASCFAPELEVADGEIGTPSVKIMSEAEFAASCRHMQERRTMTPMRRLLCPEDKRRVGEDQVECVIVDPAAGASMYAQAMSGSMLVRGADGWAAKEVVRLVYRVHFPETKSGQIYDRKNSGLQFVVTLDRDGMRPVYFTTAWTCGCYATMQEVDSDYWVRMKTYQSLPKINGAPMINSIAYFNASADFQGAARAEGSPTFFVSIGGGAHRVLYSGVRRRSRGGSMTLRDSSELGRAGEEGKIPFYHSDAQYSGLVRGACNDREISYLRFPGASASRDPFVGWDRQVDSVENPTVTIDFVGGVAEQGILSPQLARTYEKKCISQGGCPDGFAAIFGR